LAEATCRAVFAQRRDVFAPRKITSSSMNECSSGHSAVANILATASEDDLREADKRAKLVCEARSSCQSIGISGRTLRRHKLKYRRAQETYGNGYVGLLSQCSKRGNRTSRLDEETRLAMTKFIGSDYENLRQSSVFQSWAKFRADREAGNLIAQGTIRITRLQSRDLDRNKFSSEKGEGVHTSQEFYWTLDQSTSLSFLAWMN
jgi:putative transposase